MINFKALRKAMERMDGSKDGKFGRCGNWKITLGGYDMGYEVYYKDEPVMRVNYELDEYEFYSCDYSDVMFTPDTVPQIKKVLGITSEFDNVGDIDDNGDYNVSESGISKQVTNEEDSMNLKFEIEIDGVNAPIEDVENAIKDILYNQLDMELGADYNKFKVNVNHLNDKVAKESTKSASKMKFKKIVKESEGGDEPRIYVGTYAKYNDGDISGEWVDLTDFAHDYDGFVEHCREIHKDEKDPEFMIQDYEGYPSSMYHEAGLPTEEEFDKIIEISELDDSEKSAYAAYLELDFSDDSIEAFRGHYYGEYEDDDTLGYEIVEEFGMPQNPEMYFDYERFGRDLMYDYHHGDPDNTDSEGNPEDPDHYYDNDGYDMGEYHNDTQVAEDYIDSLGSIEELGKDTLNNYFDYEAFGRDILLNDMTESDGYLFWNH